MCIVSLSGYVSALVAICVFSALVAICVFSALVAMCVLSALVAMCVLWSASLSGYVCIMVSLSIPSL